MTRAQARTLLKAYANVSAGDTRWVDPDDFNLYLREANRQVWYGAVDLAKDRYSASLSITWPANTINLDLTGAGGFNADYHQIRAVTRTQATGVPAVTNRILEALEYAPFNAYATLAAGGGQGQDRRTYFVLQEDLFYLVPVPTVQIFLWMTYCPLAPDLDTDPPGAPTADDNQLLSRPDNTLSGRLSRHHELVVVKAAKRALVKVRETSDYLDSLEKELQAAFVHDLVGQSRQSAQPVYSISPWAAGHAE